jgi:hypothetical protein
LVAAPTLGWLGAHRAPRLGLHVPGAPARSIASSDLDLGSHDDGALGRQGESVARVGGVVGE